MASRSSKCYLPPLNAPNADHSSRTENFDEYTRRQYNAKAPNVTNPFGYDEEPLKFLHFDVFTKLSVLHQLSVWTFWNADRIREKLPEKKENDQIQWVSP